MVNQSPVPGSDRGRHRRPRRRVVVAVSAVATLGAATVGAAVVTGRDGGTPAEAAGCRSARTLEVVAAPEVAPAVRTVARSLTRRGCLHVSVRSADPAVTAAGLRRGRRHVDVWIPDSSVWAAGLAASGASLPPAESIASTPVVLAVTERVALALGPGASYAQVAQAATTADAVTLEAAPPTRSATTQAALLDLGRSLGSTPAQRGQLVALLRSMDTHGPDQLRPAASSAATPVARVVTERAVRAANTAARRTLYRAVAPATGGTSLDYPYVILSDDPTVTATARRLRDALEDPAGRARLAGSGFRTGRSASEVRPLTAAGAREALRTLAVVDRPTQTLALVDVSGSMASPVPGAPGVTRMDLARTAIRRGLGLLPDGTVAGLWRFSADLTPSTDYEQLAPLTTFTRQSRKQFAGALSRLQVDPDGGTGLYSSTLAAVRYARSGYDPTRVNSVIVLSDGKDQDATAHGIGLHRLLTTLRAENDPKRPVIVISIAYGPDGDTAAMRRISAATGGTLYTVSDPRQLPLIFSEAIGHRLSSEQK